jgi:hypothetical protein
MRTRMPLRRRPRRSHGEHRAPRPGACEHQVNAVRDEDPERDHELVQRHETAAQVRRSQLGELAGTSRRRRRSRGAVPMRAEDERTDVEQQARHVQEPVHHGDATRLPAQVAPAGCSCGYGGWRAPAALATSSSLERDPRTRARAHRDSRTRCRSGATIGVIASSRLPKAVLDTVRSGHLWAGAAYIEHVFAGAPQVLASDVHMLKTSNRFC